MKHLDLLKTAIARSQLLALENPEVEILRSLEPQLRYLLDLLEGKQVDKKRLSELSFGIINVREVEERDAELSDLLYQISDIVEGLRYSSRR